MRLYVQRNLNNTLSAVYDSDLELLKTIKRGDIVEVDIKRKRNVKFHKKYFALLNLVYQNQDRYNNIEHLRRDLTIEAGYYDVRYNLHGVEIYEPKSISFSSMDETEFNDYYSKVLDVVVVFLGSTREEILENIEQFF